MNQDPDSSTRRGFLNRTSAAAVVSGGAAVSGRSQNTITQNPITQNTIKPGVSARSASRVVGRQ